MGINILEIKNLKKRYISPFLMKKVNALNGVEFSVKEGEIFGLLGPNGAGKTTILKSIVGLLRIDEGEIKLFGEKINLGVKERIGFLPENPYFYRHLTGYETLCFYSSLYDKKISKSEIIDILEKVGLKDGMTRRIGTYSKGMLQRIGFAQAIINNPDLIILDEPMSGLDPIGRKEMKDWIFALKKSGKTILFSSHILSDVEEICDTVGIIIKGKIVEVGELSEILGEKVDCIEVKVSEIKIGKMKGYTDLKMAGNDLLCRLNNNEELQKFLKLVLKENGKILSVQPIKKRLEEYFVEVIKNK